MGYGAPYRLSRHRQRAISALLSAVLCLWLVAFSTHLHAADPEKHTGHSVVHLCGFCASLPVGAGAPAVTAFVPLIGPEYRAAPAGETEAFNAAPVASYRSRAPPAL